MKKNIVNSDSDSNSDNEEEVIKKVIPKKSAPKKLVKIQDKVDKVNNIEIQEDLETIDSLLAKKDYATLEKNIPKYKIITSKDVNNIINSNPLRNKGHYKVFDIEIVFTTSS
jgi:hypothetical protein